MSQGRLVRVWPDPLPGRGAEVRWQGPSQGRDTQLRSGDQLQGGRRLTGTGCRAGRAGAGQARQAEGRACSKAQRWERPERGSLCQRGPPGDRQVPAKGDLGRPGGAVRTGRGREGTAGRRAGGQEGRRVGDVTSADQAPTPARLPALPTLAPTRLPTAAKVGRRAGSPSRRSRRPSGRALPPEGPGESVLTAPASTSW